MTSTRSTTRTRTRRTRRRNKSAHVPPRRQWATGRNGVTSWKSSGAAAQRRSGAAAHHKNTAIARRSEVAAQDNSKTPQNARAAQRRSGDKNKTIAQRSGVAAQRRSGARQFKDTTKRASSAAAQRRKTVQGHKSQPRCRVAPIMATIRRVGCSSRSVLLARQHLLNLAPETASPTRMEPEA